MESKAWTYKNVCLYLAQTSEILKYLSVTVALLVANLTSQTSWALLLFSPHVSIMKEKAKRTVTANEKIKKSLAE